MRRGFMTAAFAAAALLIAGTAADVVPRHVVLPAINGPTRHRRVTPKSGKRSRGSGDAERSRRRRQIAASSLTESNGLVVEHA